MNVGAGLREVRDRIARAGGDPTAITVVAVTKGFGPEAVAAARAVGLDDLGENRADELLAKHDGAPRWHFLGEVQRRKVRDCAPVVDLWHGIDRMAEGEAIAEHRPGAAVLVQVNSAGDDRAGCRPEAVPALVEGLHGLGLDVRGLMTVAPGPGGGPARPAFALVRRLADDLGLRERSMGMTGDLEEAVAEGTTMVRVGRALFGPRSSPADLRR